MGSAPAAWGSSTSAAVVTPAAIPRRNLLALRMRTELTDRNPVLTRARPTPELPHVGETAGQRAFLCPATKRGQRPRSGQDGTDGVIAGLSDDPVSWGPRGWYRSVRRWG